LKHQVFDNEWIPIYGLNSNVVHNERIGKSSELGRDDGLFSSIMIFIKQLLKVVLCHAPVLVVRFEGKRHTT